MSRVQLRDYQVESVNAIFEKWQTHRSTLLVAATGTGKTTTFSAVAERFVAETGRRVCIMAHREELVTQPRDRLLEQTSLTVGVEMAEQRPDRLFMPQVVVTTVQSMTARCLEYDPVTFGLIIVDEAHHAVGETYRKVLAHFASAKVLGATATADRADGIAMGLVFESVAYVYEIRDAIEHGYLVSIRQRAVKVDGLDLSKVKNTRDGDLSESDLSRIFLEEKHLHAVALPTVELSEGRKTIVFATSVEHAHALVPLFDRYAEREGAALALDGKTDKQVRRDTLKAFKTGAFRFLINYGLFTEGFDEPSVGCIAVARPTKSRALYCQMAGRALRPFPGKSDALLLDFEGNAGKHALVSALDILDGNTDPAVKERAERLIAANPQLDILAALDAATKQLADEERQRQLAEARKRQQVKARAQYQAQVVDPFVTVQTVLGVRLRAGRWGGAPPSEKQLEVLARAKIDVEKLQLDRGMASQLIDEVMRRRREGLCTYAQAKILAKHGLNPDLSFSDARAAIDELAANGWRPRAVAV